MNARQKDGGVLLVGGTSGVGKTSVAIQLGLHLGATLLHIDDVWLAFQGSRVTLPQRTESLYFFEETPAVWTQPPERLLAGFIGVGQVLSAALEVIIENHVDTDAPIVIEGDAILPSLWTRLSMRDSVSKRHVQGVFLIETEEEVLFTNIVARGRGFNTRPETELRKETRARWLFGQWLVEQAHQYGLPVLEPRPWSTLVERILVASTCQ